MEMRNKNETHTDYNYLHQGGYVFTLFVCLSVCRINKSYSTNFQKICWKVVGKNLLDSGGNPDDATLVLG